MTLASIPPPARSQKGNKRSKDEAHVTDVTHVAPSWGGDAMRRQRPI